MLDDQGLLKTFLLGDGTIAGLIGDRIYPILPPQKGVYPLITLQELSTIRHQLLKGRPGLASPRYKVDIWAEKTPDGTGYASSRTLRTAVIRRLEGFVGTVTDATVSPPVERRMTFEFDGGGEHFEGDVASGGYFRQRLEFLVWFQPRAFSA